jgi:polysaccharide chain length determinant protein (PEP-CTERM system associated)
MDEIIRQLMSHLRGAWQRRWIGLAAAWIVGVAGAVGVLRMPDKYEANARIYVDTQSVLKPLMSGLAVQPNVDQQIVILSRTLISRPNVEKLIRMADLDLKLKTKEDKEALIDEMTKTLEIKSTGRDNLYTLSFRDREPEKAKRVVQSLTSIFVESSLGDKRKDSDSARKFIEDQIKVYEAKLQEAENRLKDFKLKNMALTTGEGKDYFGKMGELNAQLNQARLELREAENSRDAFKRQLAGEDPVLLPESPDMASSVSIPEIDGRIDAMKRNLDALLQRYTDQHPDVSGTKRVIEQLEEQKRKEVAARKKAGPQASSANANPVYQQLKVSMGEAEANIASLRARVAEYENRHRILTEAAKRLPQIDAEFAQLNRDYEVHKKNYEGLVARRESATMSGEMEAASGVADFRLIDPPRVSPQPVAPNRYLLLLLVLLVSLVAGVAASFIYSQIRPTVSDARSLRELTGLPILGTVSLVINDEIKRMEKRDLVRFAGGLAGLVGSYGAALLLLFITARSV